MFGHYYSFMILKAILDLFFPKMCLKCGVNGAYLCERCFAKFSFLKIQRCPKCGSRNYSGRFCNSSCGRNFCFDQLLVCMNYNESGVMKKLIALHKYRFIEELAEIFGKIVCKQFGYCSKFLNLCEKNLVVPVPLHKSRLKYRGFNQAALLAAILARDCADLQFCGALERAEYRDEQANLKRIQRLSNLRNAFDVKTGFAEAIYGRNIVLIDDVATTLSTLNECSRALKNAGAQSVTGLVLARVERFC